MRTRSIIRRTVAVTASASLLAGGLTLAAAPARAAGLSSTPASVADVTPTEWDNRSSKSVTLIGTDQSTAGTNNFATGDRIVFQPYCAIDPTDPNGTTPPATCTQITGPEVGEFGATVSGTVSPIAKSVSAVVNFASAPPGWYRVIDRHPDGTPSGVAIHAFKVFGFGPANATGIKAGDGGTASQDPTGSGADCGITNAGCGRGVDRPLDVSGSNIAVGATVRFLGADGNPDGGLTFKYGNASNGNNAVGDSSGTSGSNDVPKTAANGNDINTAYPSASLIQGGYNYKLNTDGTAGFAPGLHTVQVVNTDLTTNGQTTTFSQPYYAPTKALSPASLGKGAQQVVLTVTGQGFRPGSSLVVESKSVTNTCNADVTMGATTVSNPAGDGTYTTISAPVTLTECIDTSAANPVMLQPRTVTVLGPDGAQFSRPGILTITPPPTFAAIQSGYGTLGQGAHVGFVTGSEVTITGSGFVGDPAFVNKPGGDPSKMTAFSLGDKNIVVTTIAVPSSGTALVSIDVGPNPVLKLDAATLGLHPIRATNPDGGSTLVSACVTDRSNPPSLCKTGTTAPPTISAGPTISSVTPGSFQKTQSPVTVTVKGSGFSNQINTSNVSILPAGIDYQAVTSPDAATVTFSASTTNATPGTRTITIENPTDHGRAVCSCMGVDSLSVLKVNNTTAATPATAPNSGPVTLTMGATGLDTVGASSTATLSRPVALHGQPDIVGTSLAPAGSNQATATFDLTNVAPGRYNLTVVKDPSSASPTSWSCTACVEVDGAGAITVTKVDPATGGVGAVNRKITLTGTNFAKGMTVSIPDKVQVSDVTFVSTTSITALVTIPSDAVVGSGKKVTVTSGDGSSPATPTGSVDTSQTFTVTAAPVLKTISPSSLGQGAGTSESGAAQTVTVTGSGLQNGVSLALGSGVTFTDVSAVTPGTTCTVPVGCTPTDDSFTAKIQIAQSAAPGKRVGSISNTDGGTSTTADAFTVTPGPAVSAFASETGSPALRRDGQKHSISIVGSGFSTASPQATLTISKLDGSAADFVKVENVAVASGSKITANVTVATTAPVGALRIGVTNPGDKGFGSCDTCFFPADPPAAPGLALTPGGGSVTASWTTPASNGAPITGYRVSIQRTGGTQTALVGLPSSTLSYTFTGLTNGTSYTVSVVALNAAGESPAATASAVAGVGTALTAAPSSRLVTAGSPVRFTGKLVSASNNAPISGATVLVRVIPSVGSSFTRTVTTNLAGGWTFTYAPAFTFRLLATFADDGTHRAASAAPTGVYVASKIVRTVPSATSSTSSTRTKLKISGYVSPNHYRSLVYLYRYVGTRRTLVGRTTLNPRSTFTFLVSAGRGTYVFRIYIGAARGNVAALSTPFRVRRV